MKGGWGATSPSTMSASGVLGTVDPWPGLCLCLLPAPLLLSWEVTPQHAGSVPSPRDSPCLLARAWPPPSPSPFLFPPCQSRLSLLHGSTLPSPPLVTTSRLKGREGSLYTPAFTFISLIKGRRGSSHSPAPPHLRVPAQNPSLIVNSPTPRGAGSPHLPPRTHAHRPRPLVSLNQLHQ